MTDDSRLSWEPWAALVVAAVLYGWFQVGPLLAGSHQNDFKHVWLGALLLAEGQSPYAPEAMKEMAATFASEDPRFGSILPYVYLPFTGVVLRPLTWMSFGAAAIVWQALNHALLLGGLLLAARAGGWKWRWQSVALVSAAVVFNYTVFRQNNAGQLNMVLVFGSALLAFGIAKRRHPAALGFVAAFLMLFKLTPGIFLVWFLLTRRWREAAWTAGFAVLLTLLTLPLAGLSVHLAFLPVLSEMGYGGSSWADEGMRFWRDPYNQSPNSFFSHIMEPAPGFTPWIDAGPRPATLATWGVSLTVLAGLAWACVRRPQGNEDWKRSFSLAILASLLVPSILWDHYLVQVFVPGLLLWNAFAGRWRTAVRTSIVFGFAIWTLGVGFDGGFLHPGMLASVGMKFQLALPGRDGPAGLVWMSLKLWPLAMLFGVAALGRPSPSEGDGRAGLDASGGASPA